MYSSHAFIKSKVIKAILAFNPDTQHWNISIQNKTDLSTCIFKYEINNVYQIQIMICEDEKVMNDL